MKEITINIIEKLLGEDLSAKDIATVMSNIYISEALESGAEFEIEDSVEDFGKANCDNDLYEDDGDFQSWGEFLLSVPTASRNMKLPSGKVFSVIE